MRRRIVPPRALQINRRISRVQHATLGAPLYAPTAGTNAGARRRLMLDAAASSASQDTIVLDTLMVKTISNKTDLQKIRTGVDKLITEALAQAAMLDNKIKACDELIVDLQQMLQMTLAFSATEPSDAQEPAIHDDDHDDDLSQEPRGAHQAPESLSRPPSPASLPEMIPEF